MIGADNRTLNPAETLPDNSSMASNTGRDLYCVRNCTYKLSCRNIYRMGNILHRAPRCRRLVRMILSWRVAMVIDGEHGCRSLLKLRHPTNRLLRG